MPESQLMIDRDIHYAITELSPEDRRDRDKVNKAAPVSGKPRRG
jgi:hypothetical protein